MGENVALSSTMDIDDKHHDAEFIILYSVFQMLWRCIWNSIVRCELEMAEPEKWTSRTT
jgi:hypothetical protein